MDHYYVLWTNLNMSLVLDSGFEIVYCGYVDFEKMAIEVVYKGLPILLINQELDDQLEADIYNQHVLKDMEISFEFSLEDFLYALEKAEEMIREC
jgi:hypothetical protein